MASELGKAYVQVIPSASGLKGALGKVMSGEGAAAGAMAGTKMSQAIGTTMQKVGGGMMKAGAIATAVSVPMIAGIKSAMSAYQVQNAAETKLTEIYKTRMGATKDAAKATMDLASALQKQGVVGDEVQLSGAQQLATFAKYPSTVNSLLPAMNNLLVQQKGLNGTEQDATQIANLMGKVMMGQTGALRRVGVSFDEGQEKVLKYGTEQEKAAMLSEVITQNVGNMNKVMAETPEGKIQQMKNAFGDLVEKVGGALAPVLADVANYISQNILPKIESFIKMMQGNSLIPKIIVGLTGILAIGGPILTLIGGIVSMVGGAIGAIGALPAAVSAVAAPIAAVVAVLALAYAKSESFRKAVNNLVKGVAGALKPAFAAIIPFVKLVITEVMNVAKAIGNALAPVIKFLTPIIVFLAKVFATKFKIALQIAGAVIKTISAAIQAVAAIVQGVAIGLGKLLSQAWNGIKNNAGKAWRAIVNVITAPLRMVASVVRSIIGAIKRAFNFSSILNGVKNTFKKVYDFITSPIKKAKELVNSAIKVIKGLFPLKLGKIFSGFKLPHFKIDGGKLPWGIGGKGKAPSVGIKWYQKAEQQPYMFKGATLFGAGEHNDEVLYGRNALMKDIRSAVNGGQTTINLYTTVNGAESAEDWATDAVAAVQRKMRVING